MSEEVRRDLLTPPLAARYAATLDRTVGEAAPQGIHWCLCVPDAATAALGLDGHPAGGGGFLPASPLPRRMWAGSEVEFHAPIRVGAAIERRSRVAGTADKAGAAGPLLFVTVAHETHADGALAVRERQTIVYRDVPTGAPPPPPRPAPEEEWDWRREVVPTAPLLFRYSALTFNSHRIHYDLAWSTREEGYPGLVVHGPLMATLLLDLAERGLGPDRLARFAFRAVAPAFADAPLLLLGRARDGAVELRVRSAAAGHDHVVATGAVRPTVP